MRLDGSLKDYSLADLLEIILRGGRNGVIKIFSYGKEGIIFVKDGFLKVAKMDSKTGKNALKVMFEWKEGRFILDTEEEIEVSENTPSLPLQEVILSVTKEIDEEKEIKRIIKNMELVPFIREIPEEKEYIELTKEEWYIVAKIDGKKSVRELLKDEKDEKEFLKNLAKLVKEKIVGFSS